MNIKIKKNWEIKENKVTDEKVFFSRRSVVKGLTTTAVAGLLGPSQNHTKTKKNSFLIEQV